MHGTAVKKTKDIYIAYLLYIKSVGIFTYRCTFVNSLLLPTTHYTFTVSLVVSVVQASNVTSRELRFLRDVSRSVFKCEAKNLLHCKRAGNNSNDVRNYSDIWFDLHTSSTLKYLKFLC